MSYHRLRSAKTANLLCCVGNYLCHVSRLSKNGYDHFYGYLVRLPLK